MNAQELKKSVETILDFLDERECGESYWTDDEGRRHHADIGYVNEFLEDLRVYLSGEWKEPKRDFSFNFRIVYKLLGNSLLSELFCSKYEEIILNDKKSINAINGNTGCHIPFSAISFLKIYDVATEECVFAYFAPL